MSEFVDLLEATEEEKLLKKEYLNKIVGAHVEARKNHEELKKQKKKAEEAKAAAAVKIPEKKHQPN